ncbi:MAG: hypothetical protein ACE5R6_01895 [Candidatus Heimdallarchaeota archaeon]
MLEEFVLPSALTSLFLLIVISALLRAIITALIPFESVKKAFFFPGVIVHETAHAAVSKLLRVSVREINFLKGYVITDPGDLNPLKQFVIGISPLLFSWLIGGSFFITANYLLAVGFWLLGIIFVLLGISTLSYAAPSSQDIANFLQGEAEAVITAVWVCFCGVLGFATVLRQSFGALQPFKQDHLEVLAMGGAVLAAIMGYLVYWAATHNEQGGKEEWIL